MRNGIYWFLNIINMIITRDFYPLKRRCFVKVNEIDTYSLRSLLHMLKVVKFNINLEYNILTVVPY